MSIFDVDMIVSQKTSLTGDGETLKTVPEKLHREEEISKVSRLKRKYPMLTILHLSCLGPV